MCYLTSIKKLRADKEATPASRRRYVFPGFNVGRTLAADSIPSFTILYRAVVFSSALYQQRLQYQPTNLRLFVEFQSIGISNRVAGRQYIYLSFPNPDKRIGWEAHSLLVRTSMPQSSRMMVSNFIIYTYLLILKK